MSIGGIIKFLLGFFLAIALLAGGGVVAALYFAAKLTARPPKPIFADEQPVPPAPEPTPPAAPEAPTPAPPPTPEPKPELEPGLYRARVTWPEGLMLRDAASNDAGRVGGVAENATVVVLEQTADGEWERIRIEETNQEGWVAGGNTERIE